MNNQQIINHLQAANEVAKSALAEGHHPFGAVLVAPDEETILFRQGNVDKVRHAESELARLASLKHPEGFLWQCTLVTTVEPCAMCTGTLYWAHIGRLVYGVSETDLKALTGNDSQNPTLDLPCRSVVSAGQKPIEVHGPIDEMKDSILQLHRTFWNRND